jgi:hypothetical protein
MTRKAPIGPKGQLTATEARLLGTEVRAALRQIQRDLQNAIAKLDAVDAALGAARRPPKARRR